MRTISGHYTDNFGKEHAYNAQIPVSWDDLDAYQYATILKLLTYQKADKHVMANSFLSVLFGPKNWHILNFLPDELLYELVPLTNFILDTAPSAINKFPKLKIRKKECFAPAEDLSNIGFGEWCFAYEYYTAFLKTGDITWLNKLIAALYRPADPQQVPGSPSFNGDIRLPFNENLVDDASKAVGDIEERIRLAVLGWLRAAFSNIQETRKSAFPEPEKDEEGNVKESPAGDARTWLTVFRELLGVKWGLTGDLKFTNALFVLDYLDEQQLEFNRSQPATQ
jgi:hypothetical protein